VTVIGQCKKTADTQTAHLVFAQHTSRPFVKQKEPFFANAPTDLIKNKK